MGRLQGMVEELGETKKIVPDTFTKPSEVRSRAGMLADLVLKADNMHNGVINAVSIPISLPPNSHISYQAVSQAVRRREHVRSQ